MARQLCHVRGIGTYFALVVAGSVIASLLKGATGAQAVLAVAPLVVGASAVLGFLLLLAWRISRTTEYTLTTHRLVMRFGVALPATLAIPHAAIARASVTIHRDHTGDLPLAMKPGYRVRLHRVWPHSRPWRLATPQPMLRSVPRAGQLAALLAGTLAQGAWKQDEQVPVPVSEAA